MKKSWQMILLLVCIPLSVAAFTQIVDLPAPSFIHKRTTQQQARALTPEQDQFQPASLAKNASSLTDHKAHAENNPSKKLSLIPSSQTANPTNVPPQGAAQPYHPKEQFKLGERPMSDAQTAAVYKELLGQSKTYPFEINQELYELSQKAKNQNLSESEVDRFLQLTAAPPMVAEDQGQSSQESAYRAQSSWNASAPATYQRGKERNKKGRVSNRRDGSTSNTDLEFSAVPTGLQSGYAQAFQAVEYNEKSSSNPLLEQYNFTHENLRIHSAHAGQNASPTIQVISRIQPPFYETKALLEQGMHSKYRIGPDWDTHWVFYDIEKRKKDRSYQDPMESTRIDHATEKHLMTLGRDGSVVFEVTDGEIENRDGPDFVIWSNPFCYIADEQTRQRIEQELDRYHHDFMPFDGNAKSVIDQGVSCFTELAKVEVSNNGAEGPFEPIGVCNENPAQRSGCAGYGFNLWKNSQDPFSDRSGGDRFDLADTKFESINAIRITDLNIPPPASIPAEDRRGYIENGFDLDAIAILHYQGDQSGQ
jgi:hypothetical protein